MNMDEAYRVGKSLAHLSKEDAYPIAQAIIRECPNAGRITADTIINDCLPAVDPRARAMWQRAERSRSLRESLVRELGTYLHPVRDLTPAERVNLVQVLHQEGKTRGWDVRTYTYGKTGMYFYSFWEKGTAPPPARDGRSAVPDWVQVTKERNAIAT